MAETGVQLRSFVVVCGTVALPVGFSGPLWPGFMGMSTAGRHVSGLKWISAAACLLVAGAWAVSLVWGVGYLGWNVSVNVLAGRLGILVYDYDEGDYVGWNWHKVSSAPRWLPAWDTSLSPASFAGANPPMLRTTRLFVPLWMPLAGLIALTGWLWRRDRIPPGCCRHCGYDLTGNVSGRCPECGCACGGRHDYFTSERPARSIRPSTDARPEGKGQAR